MHAVQRTTPASSVELPEYDSKSSAYDGNSRV